MRSNDLLEAAAIAGAHLLAVAGALQVTGGLQAKGSDLRFDVGRQLAAIRSPGRLPPASYRRGYP